MLLSFVQAVVAYSVTAPRVCTLVLATIRQDTRLWRYSGLKPMHYLCSKQCYCAEGLHFSGFHYLGIDFTSDGGWDTHVKRVIINGRKKVNQLHSIFSNRNINLTARRLFFCQSLQGRRQCFWFGGAELLFKVMKIELSKQL